ncbi:MAG TPA: acetamidase/formamidase family protein [Bryobacteraceae bacterium]|nr:acetamidase/formamidase family protein [Bryobacteraceae bacterium]
MRISGLCAVLLVAGTVSAATLNGVWEFTFTRFGEPFYRRATLETSGDKLTGKSGEVTIEGTANGDSVAFAAKFKDGKPFGEFKGTLLEGVLVGTATLFGDQPATWTAQRPAERPVGARKEHRFFARTFHREFSGATPPVMHIFPGDSVTTATVDAGGRDASEKPRSLGGNPLTGPFYIENAWPGDTLVVHFKRIRLNRDSAGSGDGIVASAFDPYYFKDLKPVEKFDSTWRLDREKGIAVLKNPTEKLKNFSIKLAPMLGCVGVAPPGRNAFQSGHLGSYGGNMDYNQIREGVTLYLPVYHPGALLYVGDGHAAEGDGELTGDALETSMDVEFSVDVVEGESIDNPRAENNEYVMAMGVGNSLPDALQGATTNLAQWLEHDYKLNAAEVAMVLGTSMRYDIAEIVDPQVNVAAKVSKSVLAQLRQ